MAEPRTIEEPFLMDGERDYVRLQFGLTFAPFSVTEDNVAQQIGNAETDRFSPGDGVWYWKQTSDLLFKIPAVSAGVVVRVTYQPTVSNVVIASAPDAIAQEQTVNDPTGLADPNLPEPQPDPILGAAIPPANYTPPTPSGIYAQALDAPYIQDLSTAQSVTAGRLRATSVTPLVIKFGTIYPGFKCGQNLSIIWPQYNLNGLFVVTDINKQLKPTRDLGRGSALERTITCAIIQTTFDQEPADTSGITVGTSTRYPIQPYTVMQQAATRTAVQPDPLLPKEIILVLGGGGDLVGGDPIGTRYKIQHTGTLVTAIINARTPPINQRLVVDVFQDGVSIFGPRKFQVNSGDDSFISVTVFASSPAPYRINKGSVITFSAAYLTGSGTRTPAQNVSVQLEWLF